MQTTKSFAFEVKTADAETGTFSGLGACYSNLVGHLPRWWP
jgi:hypothetical protein